MVVAAERMLSISFLQNAPASRHAYFMIGRTLSHFEITAKLGEGGMGEVWRATNTSLHRDVALRVLPAEMAADPERLERFKREAQALRMPLDAGTPGNFGSTGR